MTDRLSRLIKTSIDTWAMRLRTDSPLVAAAESGGIGPRALALYLESLRYVFMRSQVNILAAASRCDALQLSELAAYFRDKASEEHGHDQWAANDLMQLPSQAIQGVEPAPACRALVALQTTLIAQHPACFLAYTVWAEYLTASLGDEWLRLLARSGYARSAVTSVAMHLEADVEHAFAGFDALDRLWQGEPDAATVLAGVECAKRGFEAFCVEICEAQRPVAVGDVRLRLPT